MAFRDDNEALQAKVKRLQDELGAANATLADLQGDTNFAKPELLPKRTFGFKRRVRTIDGHVDPEVYEQVVQMLQSGAKETMTTSLVGRILTAKSRGLQVTVLPGEDDDLLLVFDEYPPRSYILAFILFAFMLMAALGAALDEGAVWGLVVLVVGALVTGGVGYLSKRSGDKKQARRDELFVLVGGLLQRSAARVRVGEDNAQAAVEVGVDEIPLEGEVELTKEK